MLVEQERKRENKVCIRMYVTERLRVKDEGIGKLFHQVRMAGLAEPKKDKVTIKPLVLHIRKRRLAYS